MTQAFQECVIYDRTLLNGTAEQTSKDMMCHFYKKITPFRICDDHKFVPSCFRSDENSPPPPEELPNEEPRDFVELLNPWIWSNVSNCIALFWASALSVLLALMERSGFDRKIEKRKVVRGSADPPPPLIRSEQAFA